MKFEHYTLGNPPPNAKRSPSTTPTSQRRLGNKEYCERLSTLYSETTITQDEILKILNKEFGTYSIGLPKMKRDLQALELRRYNRRTKSKKGDKRKGTPARDTSFLSPWKLDEQPTISGSDTRHPNYNKLQLPSTRREDSDLSTIASSISDEHYRPTTPSFGFPTPTITPGADDTPNMFESLFLEHTYPNTPPQALPTTIEMFRSIPFDFCEPELQTFMNDATWAFQSQFEY